MKKQVPHGTPPKAPVPVLLALAFLFGALALLSIVVFAK